MKRYLVPLVIVGLVGLATVSWPHPNYRLLFQKIATEMVMPYALVWWGLAWIWIASWRDERRWFRSTVCGVLLLHTLGGNGLVAQYLLLRLERPFQQQQTYETAPLDAMIVLGGGTDEARNGYAEAGTSGDRVVVAARAYYAGLTDRIICTGKRMGFGADRLDPADEAFEILTGLGVPAEKIELIGGVNTVDEMRKLDDIIKPGQRIGIVTSAWHMGRAVRLAESRELELIPLPADFRTDAPIQFSPFSVIPNVDDAADIKIALREYLAWVVGR